MVEKRYLLFVVFSVVFNENVALNAIYVNNNKIDKLELDRIKLLRPSEPNVYVTKGSLLTKENFTNPLNYYQYFLGSDLNTLNTYPTTTDPPETTTTEIPSTTALNYADDLSSVENTLNNTTPFYKGDYHVVKRPLTTTSRPAIRIKKPKTKPQPTVLPLKNQTKLTKETLELLRKYFAINCTLTPLQPVSTISLPNVTIRKPKTKAKPKLTTTSTVVPPKGTKKPSKPSKTKKHRRPVTYVEPPMIAKLGSVLESVYNYMQDSLVSTEYVSVEETEEENPSAKKGKKIKRNSVDSNEVDLTTTQAPLTSQLYQPESKQVTFTRFPLVGGGSDNKNKLTTNIQVTSEYTPATPATVPVLSQVIGNKDKSSEESESEEDEEGDYYGGFANASYEDDEEGEDGESGEGEESDEYGESEEGTGNQAHPLVNDKEYDYDDDGDDDRDNASGKPTKVKKRKPPESLEEYSDEEGEDYDSGESSGNNGGFFSGIMASIGRFVRSFGFGSRRVEEYDDSEEGRSTTPRMLDLKKRPTRSADHEAQTQIERVHESTEKQQPWYHYPSYLFNEINEEPEIPIPPVETDPIVGDSFNDDWFQFLMPWEFFNPWSPWDDSSMPPVEVTTTPTTTTTEASSGWFPQIFGASENTEPPPLNPATPKPIIPFLPASDPLQKPETWLSVLAQHVFTTTRVPRSTTQVPSTKPTKVHYSGYQLWRVYPRTVENVRYLEDYRLSPEGIRLQWWKGPSLHGANDILVPPSMLDRVGEYLQDEGITKDVVIRNLGQAILYENPKMTRREQIENEVLHGHPLTWYRYHRYGDIVKYMNYLGRKYPKHVELIHVGRSFEGRPLTVVGVRFPERGSKSEYSKIVKGKKRLTAVKKKKTQRSAVFIEAGAHGREWIGPSVATWMLDALTKAIASNDTELENMKSVDWYILPVLNPDGYEYSHEYDRMWRKTRSKHLDAQSSGIFASALSWLQSSVDSDRICYGTDLDRNWDHRWNEEGASRSACSEYYSGSRAFSEPEAKALSKFLLNDRRHIQIYVSLHSYGQTISYPDEKHSQNGYRYSEVHEMATVAVETLRGSGSHTSYRVDRQSEVSHPSSGTSTQFARYEAGIKYSYTVELPDTGTHGFLLPPSGIEGTARDTLELVKGMIDYM